MLWKLAQALIFVTTADMNRLKAGVILDSMGQPAWVVRVLELIANTEQYYISLVIITEAPVTTPLPLLFSLYKAQDDKKAIDGPDAFEIKDASKILDTVPVVGMHDLKAIKENKPDVIIYFSDAIPSGEILAIPRHGVWSYFHSSYRQTDIPGAWEVLKREPVTLSGIELLSADGNNPVIYTSYALTDPSSIKKSRNRYYWKTVSFVPRLLGQLHDDPEHFLEKRIRDNNTATLKAVSKPLSNRNVMAALTGSTLQRVLGKISRPAGRPDWVLMYKNRHNNKDPFSLDGYKTLTPPEGHFWADPHLIYEQGKYYLFIEDYDYAKGRGHISVMELDEQGSHSTAVPILEKPYHLSYPFVFQHEGKWYMIPETSENRTIELYECELFPHKWKFKRNLAEQITAVDTTILFRDNKWWVFTNIEEQPGAMSLDELFIFYTDDIINGTLHPHPLNPVLSDVRSARPAGSIFPIGDKLMRPSQICAPYYGWGTSINEITELSETGYKEVPVATIKPDLTKRIAGVHTISIANDLVVIDALLHYKR